MRRWIAWAAFLYPRSWRERYGDEFDALVEDAAADWRQLLNVTRSAITMQVSDHIGELKLAGALMLAGALLAIVASYRVPERYVSSAVLQGTPVVDAGKTAAPDVLQRETEDRVAWLTSELAGRDNILRILRLPELNLYPQERDREPLEDLAEQIHDVDLRALPVASSGESGSAFRVSFAYPDTAKARAVVQELVDQLQRDNADINREKVADWQMLWSQPIPFSQRIDLVEPADLPSALSQPRRTVFAAVGVGAGLLLGILAVLFRRRPNLGLRIAACGLAGCAIAGGLSLLVTEQYTARAAIRIRAPFDPVHLSGAVAPTPLNYWVQRLRNEILDPDNLREMLRNPGLALGEPGAAALYKNRERALGIRMVESSPEAGAGPSFEVSAANPDKVLARKLATELSTEIFSRYAIDLQSMDTEADEQIRLAHEHRAGENLVFVKWPNLDDEHVTHYRLQLTLAGAVMGILLAVARWSAPSYRTSINGESSASL
jgi:hypothetical protein